MEPGSAVASRFGHISSQISGAKAPAEIKELRSVKIGLRILAVAIIAAMTAPAYPQTAIFAATSAQGESPELRVAAIVVPPFIMEQNGSLTGFSIDLWNAIAAQLNLKTSYQIMRTPSAIEDAMQSERVDLVVAPVVITLQRDKVFDFSIPILEAGLQIMVRDTRVASRSSSPLWDLLLLFSRTAGVWLGIALLLVLIPAHLVWLLERGHQGGIISTWKYFPGIFEAIYWALSTLTTQAPEMPRQWLARALSIFWMFAGVVFVAFYTAQLTTALTVEQIRGAIEGPDDLPGKQVGTMADTIAVEYLREHHAKVQEFSTPEQMFKALWDKKVDAVVSGAPILRYYAAHDGKEKVKMVGPEFNTAPVAIMFQLGSPLRREVDLALLALRENGTYRQLHDAWFGRP